MDISKDFTVIGYYIVGPVSKPQYLSLHCDKILSVSSCIDDIYPDLSGCLWRETGDSWEKYKAKLRLSEAEFKQMMEEVSDLFANNRMDVDGRFINLADARHYYDSYIPKTLDAKIIAVLMLKEDAAQLIEEPYWGQNAVISSENLTQGKLLGGEIIGFDCGSFHSYLCNGLDKDISERYTLSVDDYGVIQNEFPQIRLFAELIQGAGEPVLWLPCLLVDC